MVLAGDEHTAGLDVTDGVVAAPVAVVQAARLGSGGQGQDLVAQLKGKPLGSRLLLPSVMFKSGEEVFLDDMTRTQAEAALQIPINIVKSGGYDLLSAILDREAAEEQTTEHGMYEPSMKDLNLSEEGEVLS